MQLSLTNEPEGRTMTAAQMQRIRTKLAQSKLLTHDALALARKGHAQQDLIDLIDEAASAMTEAGRKLGEWDRQMQENAAAIVAAMESNQPEGNNR